MSECECKKEGKIITHLFDMWHAHCTQRNLMSAFFGLDLYFPIVFQQYIIIEKEGEEQEPSYLVWKEITSFYDMMSIIFLSASGVE